MFTLGPRFIGTPCLYTYIFIGMLQDMASSYSIVFITATVTIGVFIYCRFGTRYDGFLQNRVITAPVKLGVYINIIIL